MNDTSQQLNYSIGSIQFNRAPKRSNAFSVYLAVAGFIFSVAQTQTHTHTAYLRVHISIYRRVYTVSFQLAAAKPQAYRKYGIGVNACKLVNLLSYLQKQQQQQLNTHTHTVTATPWVGGSVPAVCAAPESGNRGAMKLRHTLPLTTNTLCHGSLARA